MHLLHLQVVHPLRRGGPLARERRAAGVGQDLLAWGQLAGQAPVLGGGGVDGMAGGDAQGVAAVKFQGPNVIGLVYRLGTERFVRRRKTDARVDADTK